MTWIHRGVLAVLPHVPRRVMRRLSARYIAGETLEEELAQLESLARRGHPGILDLLGEGVEDEADARRAQAEYLRAGEAVSARKLDVYISVKPTHFALMRSEALALELYGTLARRL